MDCRNARLLLDFARPQSPELDASETEALESHLADCPDCGPLARDERRLDDHLGQAMKAVPVPSNLRNRLLSRLGAESDARQRRWLVRLLGLAGAAAALCFLVWGGLRLTLPELVPEEVVEQNARPVVSSAAELEEWFKNHHGVDVVAPSPKDFRYAWLTYFGMDRLDGKTVPMLLFVYGHDGQAVAHVYLVRDDQFKNLKDQINQPPRGSMGYKVKVVPSQDSPKWFYVVMYTEGSESKFFIRKQPAT
jgi:hypothetical protein